MINLGTLKEITDLRSVWSHEALNFTPWVAENVDLLADAVGLDITVDETESSVGDFNVDIYASETGTDRKIIIENQLEDTDHWMDFSIGSSACHISVTQIQKRNKVGVELYINDDKELFKGLYSHKDDVESAMGLALDWRELPERKASRIIVEKDVKFDDQNAWPQQFEYIMDVCMKMKKAFRKYI